MTRDLVLTEDDDAEGNVLAHRLDCPLVQEHRVQARPIVTMIGLTGPLPSEVKRHDCLLTL